jgi:hypothetical protein
MPGDPIESHSLPDGERKRGTQGLTKGRNVELGEYTKKEHNFPF